MAIVALISNFVSALYWHSIGSLFARVADVSVSVGTEYSRAIIGGSISMRLIRHSACCSSAALNSFDTHWSGNRNGEFGLEENASAVNVHGSLKERSVESEQPASTKQVMMEYFMAYLNAVTNG